MRRVKLALWIAVIAIIDSFFCKYIEIGSVIPDLLFVFSLCYALTVSNVISVISVAAVCGVIADCMTGRIFGNYMAVYLISAVLIFIVRDSIYKEGIIIGILLIFLSNILGKSIFYLINISVLKDTGYLYSLFNIILPEAVYNTVLSVPLLILMKKFFVRKAGTFR